MKVMQNVCMKRMHKVCMKGLHNVCMKGIMHELNTRVLTFRGA